VVIERLDEWIDDDEDTAVMCVSVSVPSSERWTLLVEDYSDLLALANAASSR
jgi:hypothetical protein